MWDYSLFPFERRSKVRERILSCVAANKWTEVYQFYLIKSLTSNFLFPDKEKQSNTILFIAFNAQLNLKPTAFGGEFRFVVIKAETPSCCCKADGPRLKTKATVSVCEMELLVVEAAIIGHHFLFHASFLRGFGRVLIKKMSGFHDFIDKLPAAFTQRCLQWKQGTFF